MEGDAARQKYEVGLGFWWWEDIFWCIFVQPACFYKHLQQYYEHESACSSGVLCVFGCGVPVSWRKQVLKPHIAACFGNEGSV